MDKKRVIEALKQCPEPLEPKDYFIGKFLGKDISVKKEEKIIRELLAPSYLRSVVDEENNFEETLRKLDEYKDSKVLHFAMHGGHLKNKAISGAISERCTGDNSAAIDCVFLNACSSKGIGEDIKHCVDHVVCWDSDVHDEASRTFAEAFYHHLGLCRENSEDFRRAFQMAETALKLRQWALLDPKDTESLKTQQVECCAPRIRAAGIPSMIRKHNSSDNVVVGEKQCLVNGVLIDLPDKATKSVAEGVFELLFEAARYGVGEGTKAKGMLVVIGSSDDFETIGYYDKGKSTFEGKLIDVRKWQEFKELILPCFVKDGALCINGETGIIVTDSFIIDLSTRNADQGGGTGHRNASAVGEEGGCLAIKCSEDSCATDGRGKKYLKVFPGTREPTMVPVPPSLK